MMKLLLNRPYLPEGMNKTYRDNATSLLSLSDVKRYAKEGTPLELFIERCDSGHNLHGTLCGFHAVIPRAEAIFPAISGADKEIAVLTLVGKPVCCVLTDMTIDETGKTVLLLSRKQLQIKALDYLLQTLSEGDVIPAAITSMAPVGVFADIGCGVIALLPIRQISVSRIGHPRERFCDHAQIFAAIQRIDPAQNRFLLSHKELLGTWEENAAVFHEGETVTGIVRGVKSYGIFIELAPNLTGLAEPCEDFSDGDRVSVLIKAILPERHKVKLHIVGKLPPQIKHMPLHYYIKSGNINGWSYT